MLENVLEGLEVGVALRVDYTRVTDATARVKPPIFHRCCCYSCCCCFFFSCCFSFYRFAATLLWLLLGLLLLQRLEE